MRQKHSRTFCSLKTFVRAGPLLSRYFESASRSFTRETGDCVADDARRASPIKRAELSVRRRRYTAGSRLCRPSLFVFFFSLVTFDSPTFALAMPPRRGRARREKVGEREKVGTLMCRAFCAWENARRVLIAAWLSRMIYSPIRWKRIYHSFPFAFAPPPFLLFAFSIDSACST